MTKTELQQRATALDIEWDEGMTKADLVEAIDSHTGTNDMLADHSNLADDGHTQAVAAMEAAGIPIDEATSRLASDAPLLSDGLSLPSVALPDVPATVGTILSAEQIVAHSPSPDDEAFYLRAIGRDDLADRVRPGPGRRNN